MRTRHSRDAAAIALAVVGGAVIAGCSAGGGSSGSSAGAVSVSAPYGAPAAHAPAAPAAGAAAAPAAGSAKSAAGGSGSGGSAQSSASRLIGRSGAQLVYTAQLTVRAKDVASALARATDIATSAGGYVSSEDSGLAASAAQQPTATVELKIPVTVYDTTLAQLANNGTIGTEVQLRQQTQDVTQQVADVASQVASDQAAIAQLRALMQHAGSIGDLLNVQNQVNSEESDLESLQAQQRALDGETSYGTLTLTIVPVPVQAAAKIAPRPQPPGLLSGLSHGWHAFTVTVRWILAIVGAVAPFAATVAAIVILGYLIRRRNATRRSAKSYFSEELPPGPRAGYARSATSWAGGLRRPV